MTGSDRRSRRTDAPDSAGSHLPARPLRVSLLDHLTLRRNALAARLATEPGFVVVASSGDPGTYLSPDRSAGTDVLVSNYALARESLDGIALLQALQAADPRARTLVLTHAAGAGLAEMAIAAGARGVVSRARSWEELVSAVRAVAEGDLPILPDLLPVALLPVRPGDSDEPLLILEHPWLTAHERDVIRCCLTGLSVSAIATKLRRSVHTVSTQKRGAYAKLGIRSDSELFRLVRKG